MDSLFTTIYPYKHLAIAVLEIILLLFAYPFFRLSGIWAMIVLPIVLVASIYDNTILGIGRWIGEGTLLENLSQGRYLLHYLAIPLLIVVAIELAYLSEAKWANKFVRVASWLLAFGIAGYDVVTQFIGLELKPELLFNVLRYVPVDPQIPISTILINVFVLAVGVGIWMRTKTWRWLFIGALISLVGNAIPVSQLGTLPGSFSELLLSLSLLLTQYHLEDEEEKEEDDIEIEPPEGWEKYTYEGYVIFSKEEEKYIIYQTGEHQDGSFVRVYAPKNPCQKKGKSQVVTYLHGFSLSMPQFYGQHLEELVNEGYYVFFPDFQRSDYPNFPEDDATCDQNMKEDTTLKYGLFGLGILLIQILLGREVKKKDLKRFAKQGIGRALQVALGRLFFIIFIKLFYLFDREYGKNVLSMITTVIASLTDKPEEWLDYSVQTTSTAWELLSKYSEQEQIPELIALCQASEPLESEDEAEIDFYLFGHSLGGLLALSWPSYLKQKQYPKLSRFTPKQIVTGDPAPSTELGIPGFALWILRILRFPFATNPLNIKQTGKDLNLPVGILHGNADKLVKPTAWVTPPASAEKGYFFAIASDKKKIYFSLSDPAKDLIADHNQSVTNSTYYGNGFMKNFGGAKDAPNAYNYEYIWPALLAVIADNTPVYDLKNGHGFELTEIKVNDNEPIVK